MRVTWIACLYLAVCSVPFSEQDSPPVFWKLYSNINMTWNEASKFCRDRGGHLPVTDTQLTYDAFKFWADSWDADNVLDDFWIGFYTPKANVAPYLWERNGASQPPSIDFWEDSTEPNYLDTQFCVRMDVGQILWKTKECNSQQDVVCEFYRDCCAYNRRSDVAKLKMVSSISYPAVTTFEECWNLCDTEPLAGEACVASEWHERGATCDRTSKQVTMTLSFSSGSRSPRLLQHCFLGDATTFSSTLTFKESSLQAKPATPVSTGPGNFTCTLIFNATGTTTLSTTKTATTLPETTPAKTILPTTISEITAQLTITQSVNKSTNIPDKTNLSASDPTAELKTTRPSIESTETPTENVPLETIPAETTHTVTSESSLSNTTTWGKGTDSKTATTDITHNEIKPGTKAIFKTTQPAATVSETKFRETSSTQKMNSEAMPTEPVFNNTASVGTTLSEITWTKVIQANTTTSLIPPSKNELENTTIVPESPAATENTSNVKCPCPCRQWPASNDSSNPPVTSELFVVKRNATSSFRRNRSSAWKAPTVSEVVISITILSASTFFILFFLCCDVARLKIYFDDKTAGKTKR